MARKDAQYMVFEATTVEMLDKKVTGLIQEDWHPQGGVMIVNLGDGDFLYAQAMTFNVDTK